MAELPTAYQQYIHMARYARYLPEQKRRESWEETVRRYCDYWKNKFGDVFPYDTVYKAILNLEVMPSMRALMTAGPALDRDNIAGYNCSFKSMNAQRAFDVIMYILLCGTGVGFSVERQFCQQLPEVPEALFPSDTTIVVADSKIGWASALRELIGLLYAGKIPKWDLSKIRPAGARLRTFGGRASGPQPVDDLFRFTIEVFSKAVGRRLSSLEVHDLVCKIADVVVVGGVRRSALISLSNLTDERMRNAKSGNFGEQNGQRYLANNSVAYTEKPDIGVFLREWTSLYESKSGERGIFNRQAAELKARSTGRRKVDGETFGTNPCGEIILRDAGLCNLSEVVVRSTDSVDDLRRKVEIATIIGTFQSTLTDFRYVPKEWKKNAEEERLLGVSMTGIMDHPLLGDIYCDDVPAILTELKNHAIKTNQVFAERLGINASVAITTVKPSGTVSQLVDSASGIHPRYSEYYLRTVRADKKDPLSVFMRGAGVYVEDDVTKPDTTDIFYFPQKAPTGAFVRDQWWAEDQLEHYLTFQHFWCEHNPSITVYYRDSEFLGVGAWVYEHFDQLGGVSFLPHSDHIYKQAPYQEITKEEYEEWMKKTPQSIDWSAFVEAEDNTTASQELACLSGVCEV